MSRGLRLSGRAFAAALLSLLLAAGAFAQQRPGRERGFRPEQAYQFTGFESINLFSGNLNLSVPLGQAYPVGAGLSYSFALRYSGNVWHLSEWMKPWVPRDSAAGWDPSFCFSEFGRDYCYQPTNWWYKFYLDENDRSGAFAFLLRGDAGVGWDISFGELIPPTPNVVVPTMYSMWRYKSPDGGEHMFFPTLHEPRCTESVTTNCDKVVENAGYTRDGTYLRLKKGNDSIYRIVEFPDGEKKLFECAYLNTECKLRYIYNQHSAVDPVTELPTSNFVRFDYDEADPEHWTVTDSVGRTHRVLFQQPDPYLGLNRVVDKVVLETTGDVEAKYELTYDKFPDPNGMIVNPDIDGDISEFARPCMGSSGMPLRVRLLSRVKMPNGEAYRFDYYKPASGDECEDRDSSAALEKVVLPTGGRYTWTYQHYPVAGSYTSRGVKERIVYESADANAKKLEQTVYTAGDGATTVSVYAPPTGQGEWVLNSKTRHYFMNDEKHKGLPFTTFDTGEVTAAEKGGRNLSSVTYDCRSGTCVKVRATLVKYEMDWVLENAQEGCGVDYPCFWERNRRPHSERIVYFDDDDGGVRVADTDFSLFDGLGHYRQTEISGFALAGTTPPVARQTYTSFNPKVDIYQLTSEGKRAAGYKMLDVLDPWILGTYEDAWTREGTIYSRTHACFDSNTGFLRGLRTLSDERLQAVPGGNDLLSIFTRDPDSGFVKTEEYFGGDDNTPLPTDKTVCELADAPPAHDAYSYKIEHSYAFGVLKTSKYSGVSFYSVNNSLIDKSTGLITKSEDSTGLVTLYEYDASRRLQTISPPGSPSLTAVTSYDYDNASGSTPARVSATTADVEEQYEFDPLGRLWREKRRMPDGSYSIRETLYDFAGRRSSVSEWEKWTGVSPSSRTTFSDYDVFGRAGSVKTPDLKVTTFEYDGARIARRMVKIRTSLTEDETPVWVEEEYDRLGRVVRVTEDSAASALKTDYTYRIFDRLSAVKLMDGAASPQSRTFTHDGRGLLTAEDPPESDAVTYKYDARGHARTKQIGTTVSLRFDYDSAERLTQVFDALQSRALKIFTFDQTTIPGSPAKPVDEAGRLVSQERHNYLKDGTHVVRDYFEYDGAGRVEKKHTRVIPPSGPEKKFENFFDYTTLGQPKNLFYPACLTCGTSIPGSRGLPLGYSRGLLTNIAGVTGEVTSGTNTGITYTPAGQVHQVRHAAVIPGSLALGNGVLDTYAPDTSGMARPSRITFSNAIDCNLIDTQAQSVVITAGTTASFTVAAKPNATVVWYEGMRGVIDKPMNASGSTLTTPPLSVTTYYWARVTSGSNCYQDSETYAATVCTPARVISPSADYSGDPIPVQANQTLPLSVVVSGAGTSIEWFKVTYPQAGGETETPLNLYTPSITTAAPASGRAGYRVKVRNAGGPASCAAVDTRLVTVVEVSEDTCATPDILSGFPSEIELYPGRWNNILTIGVKPEPHRPGFEDEANLGFRWFIDGQMVMSSNGTPFSSSQYLPTQNGVSITVQVWRVCKKTVNGQEVQYNSPSASRTGFLFQPENCPNPSVTISQTTNETTKTLTASSSWPSLTYQWFRGDSGRTDDPYDPGATLVVPTTAGTYWVRATSVCGTKFDSETVVVTNGSCSPLQFTRHPAPAKIPAKIPYTLTFDVIGIPGVSQTTWFQYSETGEPQIVNCQRNCVIERPMKTATYWVSVTNGCHATRSKTALVQVTSCDDITVATPPATTSINEGDWTTLSIVASSSTGSTLTYQWYEGESGDASKPIAGAVSATQALHPLITTKYWVRVKASSGCEIDLPTVTVYVCRQPYIGTHVTQYTSYSPTQAQWLDAWGTGDNLSYQWYVGTVGDTSAPFSTARTVRVDPVRTTKYWFRVTSDCQPPKTDRYADSQQVMVSVCPEIRTEPVAERPVVMRGTTTKLTIEADRGDDIVWYEGPLGNTSKPLTERGATVTTPSINADTTFWARVSSGSCSKMSALVTVKLCTKPTVQWAYSTKSQMAYNETQTLYVTPTVSPGSHLNYTWYEGESGNVAGSTLISGPGSTNISHSFTATTNKKFWVRVQEPSFCYADTPTLEINVCVPTITSQPQSVMIDKVTNQAATATLSVTAPGNGMNYQWYIGQPGDMTQSIAGATSASYTVSPSADTTYWVHVYNNCGSVNSAGATVSLCKQPVITGQPASKTMPPNVNTTLTVSATGTDLTYQWYEGASGVTTTPIASGTGPSVIVGPMRTTNYWVRISGRCGPSVNSAAAKISIAPTITTQPVGGFVMSGQTRTVSVAATGNELAFEWYAGSTRINGATGASYTTPAITANTTYWARVYSGGAYTDSAQATFTVCTKPTVSWGTGIKTAVAQGESQILSVSASVSGTYEQSYWWYVGNSGDLAGSTFAGGGGPTSSTMQIAPSITTKYWVRVRETNGCYADTPTLEVKVCVPTITSQPQSIMINSGTSTTLSVAGNGGALTYQWYIGDSGTGTPVSGATSPSLTVTPAADTKYWVRVTGSCGQYRDSATATVSICKPPQITQHPVSVNQNPNVFYTMSVSATGTDLTYQWYAGASGNTTAPYGGATSSTFQVSPINTSEYWVKVSGRCGSSNSNTVKVSVYPTITTQPVGGPITKGTTRTLTVAANGAQLTYQWFLSPGATPVSGATSASYTTPPINSDATYYARVWSGNAYKDSSQAVLTVCQPRSFSVSNPGVSGSAVTFNVQSPAAGESFEWYKGESGVTTTLAGYNSSLTIYPTTTGRYWLRTKRTGCDADSAAVTVSVCRPAITSQPQGGMINSGSPTTLSVTATGTPTKTYQWYIGDSGTGSAISGATSSSLTVSPSATTKYWVRVASPADANCGVTHTDSATATVMVCNAPVITSHPQSHVAMSGYTTTLIVNDTGDNLSYQWYEGQTGDTSKPFGENSNTVTFYPYTTKYYWVRVTGTCGVANSTAAQVSIPPTINQYPQNSTKCKGATATVSVIASGDSLTYAWYRVVSGVPGQELFGTTRDVTFTVPGAMEFWCVITSGQATTSTGHNFITLKTAPTIHSISNLYYNSSYRQLKANISSADNPYADFAWYQGALGDTTYRVGYDQILFIPTGSASQYWVRVTRSDTGCSTDMQAP